MFPDNAALAFSPDGRRLAFSAGHEASVWDVMTGEQVKSWRLSEGLGDRLAFPGPNRLLLFRVETESGELGPFAAFDPIKHPRVCRVETFRCRTAEATRRDSRFQPPCLTRPARPMENTM